MFVAYVPAGDVGTVLVVAFLHEDLQRMLDGVAEPDTVNLREAMRHGTALPSYMTIIAVKDQDEFEERMNGWFAAAGSDVTMDQFKPISELPNVLGDDDDI